MPAAKKPASRKMKGGDDQVLGYPDMDGMQMPAAPQAGGKKPSRKVKKGGDGGDMFAEVPAAMPEPEPPLAGGGKKKKPAAKKASAKKGGAFLDDVGSLAVPFAILMAKKGLESVIEKQKAKDAKKKQAGGAKPKPKRAAKKGGNASGIQEAFYNVTNDIEAFLSA
jgi:hypothetical protein